MTTVEIQDTPQTWWEVECTYDGAPGCRALAAGESPQQAEANFRSSLMYPELATDVTLKRLGQFTAVEAVANAGNGNDQTKG
jgi:hypothetical protein